MLAEAAAREERLKRCIIPPSEVLDHDLDDRDDPVACGEYAADMYKRFKELEVRGEAKPIARAHTRSPLLLWVRGNTE